MGLKLCRFRSFFVAILWARLEKRNRDEACDPNPLPQRGGDLAAAQKLVIVSRFSYTTEMLIQAGRNRMAIVSVPVRTNAPMRPSRLFSNIPSFMVNTGVTIARAYAMYNPLRVFTALGVLLAIAGLVPIVRFLVHYLAGDGAGRIQSLVLGGSMLTLGMVAIMFGILADLVARNRQLLEYTIEQVHRLKEPGAERPAAGDMAAEEASANAPPPARATG